MGTDNINVKGKRALPHPHPGTVLATHLDDTGLRQNALAAMTGFSVNQINRLCTGNALFSTESAFKIAAATGTRPEFWLALQTAYELDRVARELKGWKPAKIAA